MPAGRLLLQTSALNKIICRNAFTAKKRDTSKPNMVRVGLTFGSVVFLWGLLFTQHSNDVQEYKKRNGLE
ncbi:NADH dehydrogenase [ubiquinone] 1 subunit C1, mitochondrial [Astyanax mexicanus]|uniref:NADH dehydrogenase [ubiquinone] 1 subunit C1, mitochondrial n=2 Tax=Astyanax mexicanus TaxID=7994 RepID=A0A8B9HZS7_ASTMX|nr:NADH dehydrogenase [ubiquinone] 1 subunit C1, mitochondrial [Astyanax mexicanus]KAG9272265.1 NADH dehydrogenase ubiquinone 1 subunit C1, mitochondrial [Astyanax mexicanus]